MTAHTKGSGMTWVGRAIRRLEDPALDHRPGTLYRGPARYALGALRAQSRGGRKDQKHRMP